MMSQHYPTAKQVSLAIIQKVSPDDTDMIEEGFDSLEKGGFEVPDKVPEHAFQIPPEVWSYAQTVAVFVGGIFAGAIKDVLKERLAKILSHLLRTDDRPSDAEIADVIRAVDTEGKRLHIPEKHRERLKRDLRVILAKP
jgi:hypothetical protein